jgi:hypothetical protein
MADSILTFIGGTGTPFICLINYVLIHYVGLSYLGVFMAFSTIGFVGFLKLYRILNFYDAGKKLFGIKITYIILLLPQFHYWTSAIGKDSLMFFGLMFFLEAIFFKPHVISFQSVASLILLFFIRPYIVPFLATALLCSQVFVNRVKLWWKLLCLILFATAFYVFQDAILSYVNMSEFNSETFSERIHFYSEYSRSRDGAFIDPKAHNIFQ